MRPSIPLPNALRVLPAILIVLAAASGARAGGLICAPTALSFEDAYAGRQLLVSADGQDVTRDARYESGNPSVVRVDAAGYATPTGDGSAVIRVLRGDARLEIPVQVSGFGSGRPVDFRREIVPLLESPRLQRGRLSRQGQRPERLQALALRLRPDLRLRRHRQGGARPARLPGRPRSKPAAAQGDGAGAARRRQTPAAPTARNISCSAAGSRPARPASAPDAPHVVKLRITPSDRVLRREQSQQLAVLADYSDGCVRDVTRQAQYPSNLDVVAARRRRRAGPHPRR